MKYCVFKDLKTIGNVNNYLSCASVIIDVTSGFKSLKTPITSVNYYECQLLLRDQQIVLRDLKIIATYQQVTFIHEDIGCDCGF